MKLFKACIMPSFILADVSLILGIISKIAGFAVFDLGPLSYLRFTGICLLYAIACSLAHIALTEKEQQG